jgi:hypothetical protein
VGTGCGYKCTISDFRKAKFSATIGGSPDQFELVHEIIFCEQAICVPSDAQRGGFARNRSTDLPDGESAGPLRGTPRGLLGSIGLMAAHSQSASS